MPLTIIRQDITKMQVDAIVNAANTSLAMGGGVCGAIFKAAGPAKLQDACNKLAPIKTGGAAITPGFNLKAKYVIHAAGPIYSQWTPEQNQQLLASAYTQALMLAKENNCESIAFPLISSGIYGYPKAEAFRVAMSAISEFLVDNEMLVYLAIFDKGAVQIGAKLFADIREYIDDNYVRERDDSKSRQLESNCVAEATPQFIYETSFKCTVGAPPIANSEEGSLEEALGQIDESFSQMLMRKIDEAGIKDSDCYKRANVDRKLFSKIRGNINYKPSKQTALAFAIALELSLDETKDMLMKAGYALSHSNKFDIIIEYFIRQGNYDIYEINEALFAFDQQLLGV